VLTRHPAFRRAVVCAWGAVVLSQLLPAQSTKAELYGTVRDATGRTVPSAIVELLGHGDGQLRQSVASMDGSYHFLALPAGRFRIDIFAEGFAPLRREGIVLRVGDRLSLDLELEVGGAAQALEVTAAPDLLQASRGSVGFVVEQEKVVTLPSGRAELRPVDRFGSGREFAARECPAADQRQPATSERIHLRRHQRPAARTRAGGLLSGH
jgi:hypothetical protein